MEKSRPDPARDLFRDFAEPVLRAAATGETLDANPAFHDLAARCGVKPLLSDLFGPAIGQLLGQAQREGWTRAVVPIMAGPEPAPLFRLAPHHPAPAGPLAGPLIALRQGGAGRPHPLER